jgi:hypothetical protein
MKTPPYDILARAVHHHNAPLSYRAVHHHNASLLVSLDNYYVSYGLSIHHKLVPGNLAEAVHCPFALGRDQGYAPAAMRSLTIAIGTAGEESTQGQEGGAVHGRDGTPHGARARALSGRV